MGVRVSKTVGYGMRGFEPSLTFLARYRNCEATVGEFVEWCRPRTDEIRAFAAGDDTRFRQTMLTVDLDAVVEDGRHQEALTRHIEFNDDMGIKDAIVFIPIGYLHIWHRYNCSIDWAEETELHNQERRFVFLKRELDPQPLGKPPLTVAALALYFGVPKVWPKLREALYVNWS